MVDNGGTVPMLLVQFGTLNPAAHWFTSNVSHGTTLLCRWAVIPFTYSIGAEVLDLQECLQEAKEFSGKTVLFSGLTLMWMDVFSILSLTEKIRSIHVSTKVNRDSIWYSAVSVYRIGPMKLLDLSQKHDWDINYPVYDLVLAMNSLLPAIKTSPSQ